MSRLDLRVSAGRVVVITLFISVAFFMMNTTQAVGKISKEGLTKYWQKAHIAPKLLVNDPLPIDFPTTVGELLAKAAPDECFDGIGNPYPSGPPCQSGKPKVNQAYVWGLAKSGNDIWFGTVANTHCLVFGTYLGLTDPIETSSWVCEFGESQIAQSNPALPDGLGDFRPPKIYRYNLGTGTLTDMTSLGLPRINLTVGIRSAGTLGNVVFLGGPSLSPTGGINLFTFRTDTNAYLGSTTLTDYSDIRKWLVVNGILYAGVVRKASLGGGGRILKWTGNEGDPFHFEEVGSIDTEAAELAYHQGRIYVSTWPSSGHLAGLYRSPLVPVGGLTTADAGNWVKIWQTDNYEPDPVTAAATAGGALASFDGYLYWGTMHVPLTSTLLHIQAYGDPGTTEGRLEVFLGSERAISIFRGSNLDTSPTIELVYGMPLLPKYNAGSSTWELVPNLMNSNPLWGPSGFGNLFNCYTWSMAVYDNRLFVGTMDYSYLFNDLITTFLPGVSLPSTIPVGPYLYGADLFFFPSSASPAFPESLNGLRNYSSYGIRNMVADSFPGGSLYLGMANPMNLLADTTDSLPEGGWELIKLTAKQPNTSPGDNVPVWLDNGTTVTFCHVETSGFTAGTTIPNLIPDDGLIPYPAGFVRPDNFYLISSSAAWRQGCSRASLAQVCVPSTNSKSHLFQLQYDPAAGFMWKDITSTNDGSLVCGTIDASFIGALSAMAPIRYEPLPTLSEWGMVLMTLLLGMTSVLFLKKRRDPEAEC